MKLVVRWREINRIEDRRGDASWTHFETNHEIYRECPINFSKATSCRYVLNVDISGMLGNRLESLRVKQSGAFDLIYDTNFMEKSSIRSSIRSTGRGEAVVGGMVEGERREGEGGRREICSNVAWVIEIGAAGTIGSSRPQTKPRTMSKLRFENICPAAR